MWAIEYKAKNGRKSWYHHAYRLIPVFTTKEEAICTIKGILFPRDKVHSARPVKVTITKVGK